MKLSALIEVWDRFWFSMVSPYPVAAFRILFGLLILQSICFFAPDYHVWYGANGITSLTTTNSWDQLITLNMLNLFPDNDTWLICFYSIFAVAAFCLTIGFKTRLASILVYVALVSLYDRQQFHLNSGDTFTRAMSFWLMFSPCASVWSLDAYLQKRKSSAAPSCPLISAWTLRIMQIQVALVYMHTFIAKSTGSVWADGTAVYFASRLEPLMRLPLPVSFDVMAFSQMFTWFTLVIELLMFTLVWVKEFRYYVLALAVCMHLTIDWSMSIPQFEWLMIYSYVLFVFSEDFERFAEVISQRMAPRQKSSAAT